MCTGIAIYGTEEITPSKAFEKGWSFFQAIGVSVTGGSYFEHLEHGDHEGDHDRFEISPEQLRVKAALIYSLHSKERHDISFNE